MSIQILPVSEGIPESGTAIISLVPLDSNKEPITFNRLTNPQWQLMTPNGSVINGRSFENSALTSLQFVLTGDDTAIFGESDTGDRFLSFQAEYTGQLLDGSIFTGNVIAECTFNIFKVLGQVDKDNPV